MGELLQGLTGEIVKGISALVGAALTALITQSLFYLRTKQKIAISADVEQRLIQYKDVAIKRAEEWGLQRTRDPSVPDPTGAEKQQKAKETLVTLVPEAKKLTEDAQAALLDARLFEMRQRLSLPPLPTASVPPKPPQTLSDAPSIPAPPRVPSVPSFEERKP